MIRAIEYLREMLDALTSGYSRQDIRNARHGLPMETNIGRLFSTFAEGLQIIHQQTDKILLWDNIDNARGAVLDRYGANFGVARNGVNDAFYRLMIKVKMIALLSGGDINTVLNAGAALFDVPVETVELKEHFPAKISIHVDDALLRNEIREVAVLISRLLKRIVAAGVGFDVSVDTFRTFPTTAYFLTGAFMATDIKVVPASRRFSVMQTLYFASYAFEHASITVRPAIM